MVVSGRGRLEKELGNEMYIIEWRLLFCIRGMIYDIWVFVVIDINRDKWYYKINFDGFKEDVVKQ